MIEIEQLLNSFDMNEAKLSWAIGMVRTYTTLLLQTVLGYQLYLTYKILRGRTLSQPSPKAFGIQLKFSENFASS